MNKPFLRLALVSGLISAILGCSAGGGETGTGFDNKTVNVGVITGFGSVFVNGIEYETTNTAVTIDGAQSSEEALRVGMIVNLQGTVNTDGVTGIAETIQFEDNVEGVVLSNNVADSHRLDIMGQIIIVDNDTIFESQVTNVLTLADIAVGNVVEVSGYTSGDGTIYATRVEVKRAQFSSGETMEVQGIVMNVNTSQFQIGKLTFSYTPAVLENFGNLTLTDGMVVEVKTTQNISGLTAIAEKVVFKKQGDAISVDNTVKTVELEGYITAGINAQDEFYLNGQLLKVTNNTVYTNGSKGGLNKGVKVDVDASVDANGILVASKIEIKQFSSSRISGLITTIDPSLQIIAVAGQQVQINSSTRLQDEDDESDDHTRRYFNFTDLKLSDHVEISGYIDSTGNFLIATKLERDEPENNGSGDDYGWELDDKITSIDLQNNTIVIGGRVVDISGISFNSQVGDRIELEGDIVGGMWVARQISTKEGFEEEGQVLAIDLIGNLVTILSDSVEINIDISYIVFNAKVGDRVEFEGQVINQVMVASEMEIKDNDTESKSEDDNDSEKIDSVDNKGTETTESGTGNTEPDTEADDD